MNKRKVFFATFLLSYIVLAIVIAVIYTGVYGSYAKTLKTKSEQYNVLQLKKNVSFIDKTLQKINLSMEAVKSSDAFAEICNADSDVDIINLINIQNSLKSTEADEYLFKVQYISLADKNFIAARSNSTLGKEEYFSKIVRFKNLSDEKIMKTVSSGKKSRYVFPAETVTLSGIKTKAISVVTVFEKDGRKIGYMNSIIAVKSVRDAVIDGFENGFAAVYDENKNLLYADKDCKTDFYKYDKMLLNGKNVVIASRSDYNRWTYVVSENQKYVFGALSRVKLLIFAATLIAIIFALVFGKLFMRKNVMPIGEILDLVEHDGETEAKSSIYDNIYSYVFLLKNDLELLKKYFEKNVNFLQGGIVRKLLDGDFKSEEELFEQCRYTGLDFENRLFWITVVKSGPEWLGHEIKIKNQELVEALCYAVLEKNGKYYKDTDFYICRAGENITAILFSRVSGDISKAQRHRGGIERILKKQLDNKIGKEFYLGTGETVEDALLISRSYGEVLSAIERERAISNEKSMSISANYWYPLEVENRIANMTVNGEIDGIKKVISEIEEKNFKEQNLTDADLLALYYEIKATLVKLLKMNSVEVSEEVISAPDEKKPEAAVRYILNVIEEICKESGKKNKNRDEENYERIKHFIYKNYWNPDMSLTLISDKFGLNETYISALFKKYNGNYLSYLESVRLECACKMMLSEKININEVAEIVGYNSDQSFRRAFKRYYGISPTSYKELYKNK